MRLHPTHRRSPGGTAIAAVLSALLVATCSGPAAPEPPSANRTAVAPALPPPGTAATPSPSPALATASPSPAPSAADPPAPARALDPLPQPGRFAMDLYRRGDFVSQATVDWCVPASILTMMNVIDGRDHAARPTQRRLDRIARSLSSPRLRGPGSEPEGWAATLDRFGYGPYAVVVERTRARALRTAAHALRLTGRPVGLLVWRGAHAWVMTGFEATADPARTDDFRVTHVRVSDPWFPRERGAWGRTRGPDSRLSATRLADVFLRWRRPLARYAELDGRFVLVIPVAARR
jgi:hypothetical protein